MSGAVCGQMRDGQLRRAALAAHAEGVQAFARGDWEAATEHFAVRDRIRAEARGHYRTWWRHLAPGERRPHWSDDEAGPIVDKPVPRVRKRHRVRRAAAML